MIVVKAFDKNQNSQDTVQTVTSIKQMYNISDDEQDIIYLMEEDDVVIGISTTIIKNNIGILKSLVISDEYRGYDYGDGLLRAILNFLYRQSVETVLFFHESDYLFKKGFQYIAWDELNIEEVQCKPTTSKLMICNLRRFFSRTCKH